ncbi:MAG: ice-binding family protein [Pseudomonas sp.]|uniref:ice-binding family protein n=1 Tax=Pseudomonas sp. TaxID=306 RepID=UPI003390DE96
MKNMRAPGFIAAPLRSAVKQGRGVSGRRALGGLLATLLLPLPAFALGPTVQTFGVLAGAVMTNTGPSVVTGDLGVSPGSSVTGFPPGIVNGTIHAADAAAAQAQVELTADYNAAAGTACDVDLTGQNLGGLTLTPGTYCFATSAQLTGALTLDFQGNPNAQFLFRTGSTLTTASGSSILLTNSGGTTCPATLTWQVGSSATLGTGSSFAGDILALTSITLTTGANLSGRALARNGAVTLDTNSVTACAPNVLPPGAVLAAPALDLRSLTLLMALLVGAGFFMLKRNAARS